MDREWCAVPDCEERCYPGEDICQTHQQYEGDGRQKNDDDGKDYGHPGDRLKGID